MPLPSFSLDQIKHIAADANIGLFLCDEVHLSNATATGRPLRLITIANGNEEVPFEIVPGGVRIFILPAQQANPRAFSLVKRS